jgi:hypothetical protein
MGVMPSTLRILLLAVGLPLLAGVCAGFLLTGSEPASAPPAAKPSAIAETAALPDDPEIIKLAALAGRTKEARSKLSELLAAGAGDEEISGWLAPLLLADPAWLEKFIVTVPEERRIALVRHTFGKIGLLHPDGVWELLRSSPFAVEAAKAKDSDRKRRLDGLDILSSTLSNSPLASGVLFDPAIGFTDDEIARYFRWGTRNEVNARRILTEWAGGRWTGEPPECIRSAWLSLRWHHLDSLRDFEKTMPAELGKWAASFETLAEMNQPHGPVTTDPAAEDLKLLKASELEELVMERAMTGRPIPLSTLAQLPQELRKAAIQDYFNWHYPFMEASAAATVESLDGIELSPGEKGTLLLNAASYEIYHRGDYPTALKWAARVPDEKARTDFERTQYEQWAREDPHAVLEHARTLPDGPLRSQIERLATEAMP